MHLSNAQIWWMMFMRILIIIIWVEKENLDYFWWYDRGYYDKQKISIRNKGIIRSRKLNISLVFITQSYFSVPKDVRLNSTHYLIMKINNKRGLQNIAIDHSAGSDYKDFMKIYRECTRKPCNFLTIDTTLPASNPLRFRKSLSDSL